MADFYDLQWADISPLKAELSALKQRVEKLERAEYGHTMEMERLKSKLVDV